MGPARPSTDADDHRAYYENELARGVERFLEPRSDTCPWCGSGELAKRVRGAKDLWQGKPGRFDVDECRTCGHVFQNPRLTIEGLDFYYKDFYDGLGEQAIDTTFDGADEHNRDRAEMVRAELARSGRAPTRWLDVGTGYGHFAKHAREVLPDTTFDGLDMGVAVTTGVERGWLDRAHQGMFPELADSLAGQYDVVSMHHYLEHTPDPKAELDAAARALAPGALLLIEVPNPDYRFAKAFGRWWFNLLQPQHLHLIPMGNLLQALTERGFTPVATTSGSAHMGVDATFGFRQRFDAGSTFPQMFRVNGPAVTVPWLPEGSRGTGRSSRRAVWSKVVLGLGVGVDRLLTAIARRTDNGNSYRVLVRR